MPQLNGQPPPPRRRRGRPVGSDSAETRQRILQAARQVISERGYQAATFQAISLTAGLSRPTLHYYFATREHIYDALVAEAGATMAECMSRVSRTDPLAVQLGTLVTALQEADARDRSTVAFLVSARLEASRNPELRYRGSDAVREFLEALVQDAIARGELADGTVAGPIVELVHSMLWGVGFYSGFVADASDMEQITKQLGHLFRHGLLGAVKVS